MHLVRVRIRARARVRVRVRVRVAEGVHHLLVDLHEATRRVLDAKLLG